MKKILWLVLGLLVITFVFLNPLIAALIAIVGFLLLKRE
jgi:hypothetical protein